MSSQIRYDQLSSLAQVRAERQRLREEQVRLKRKLAQDCDQLTEVLSVDFWTEKLSRTVNQWVSTSQWALWGYELISSWVLKTRKRKARKKSKRAKQRAETRLD